MFSAPYFFATFDIPRMIESSKKAFFADSGFIISPVVFEFIIVNKCCCAARGHALAVWLPLAPCRRSAPPRSVAKLAPPSATKDMWGGEGVKNII